MTTYVLEVVRKQHVYVGEETAAMAVVGILRLVPPKAAMVATLAVAHLEEAAAMVAMLTQ